LHDEGERVLSPAELKLTKTLESILIDHCDSDCSNFPVMQAGYFLYKLKKTLYIFDIDYVGV
jgi:hypothetical protein